MTAHYRIDVSEFLLSAIENGFAEDDSLQNSSFPGLYIMQLSNGKIYIGQSRNVRSRIKQHWRTGDTLKYSLQHYGIDCYKTEDTEHVYTKRVDDQNDRLCMEARLIRELVKIDPSATVNQIAGDMGDFMRKTQWNGKDFAEYKDLDISESLKLEIQSKRLTLWISNCKYDLTDNRDCAEAIIRCCYIDSNQKIKILTDKTLLLLCDKMWFSDATVILEKTKIKSFQLAFRLNNSHCEIAIILPETAEAKALDIINKWPSLHIHRLQHSIAVTYENSTQL